MSNPGSDRVRRTLVLVNPAAAAGRAGRALGAIRESLHSLGLDATFRTSETPGHAVDLARAAADTGRFDVIVAAGGDGTVREVASGILGSAHPRTPLGILPLGTGNDFARVAGAADLPAALQTLSRGRVRALDAIEVTRLAAGRSSVTHALSFAAVGLAADVVRLTTPAVKRWFGPRLCYSVGFLRALARFRAVRATAVCDDREIRGDFLLICAGNTSHAGGGMMHLSPGAVPHDGALNITLIRATHRAEVLVQFLRLLRGTHVRHRRATYVTGGNVAVATEFPADVQLDGDIVGSTPARFRVLPAALQLLGADPSRAVGASGRHPPSAVNRPPVPRS